jgi:hypothetical protein
MGPLSARAPLPEELRGAELLFDRLDLPEEALEALSELSGVAAQVFLREDGWAAWIEVDGTAVLAQAVGAAWMFLVPAGVDEGDAMALARRLHGRLGMRAEGWDLDR